MSLAWAEAVSQFNLSLVGTPLTCLNFSIRLIYCTIEMMCISSATEIPIHKKSQDIIEQSKHLLTDID